jgi:predicted dehydrogenase
MTGSSKLLRVGVIGLGVGERHLAAYQSDPRCEVVAICDIAPERLAEVAARAPGAHATTNAAEILEGGGVDLVSIATFDDAHYTQARAALDHGKHVFVEKPLCRADDELSDLAAAHRRHPELRLASNLVLRAAPLFTWLRHEIQAGDLGQVYAFDGDYLYGRLHKITSGWRGGVAGYSVMLGGGIHMVDLMIWLLGERPSSVHGCGNAISTHGSAFAQNDFASATFQFPSGAIGRITANFGSVHRHQHVVRVFGTKATVVSDDRGPRISRGRDPEPSEDLALAALPESKGALIGRFVDAAVGAAPQDPDPDHEFAAIAACLAADRSMKLGTPVEVDYP